MLHILKTLRNYRVNNRLLHIVKRALFSCSAFFLLIQLTACSTIHFKSNHDIDIFVGHHEDMTTLYEIQGTRDFYIWGLYPDNQTVYIDEEIAIQGARRAVILKFGVDSDQLWKTTMFKMITFGMYYPVYYKVVAKGSSDFE
jgi:hypothetical protein